MFTISATTTILVLLFSSTAHGFLLGDPGNGEVVHQGKCATCHIGKFGGDGSKIYLRDDRRIKTIEGLMAQVEFCNRQIKSGLNEDEINDLVIYLNERYYKFE
jgi:cytochrome c2